jgi:hypothetical protein
MSENNYSLTSIHLPENKGLVGLLKTLSRTTGLIVTLFSIILLVGWFANVSFFKTLLMSNEPLSVFSAVLFLLASLPLLLPSPSKKKLPANFSLGLFSVIGGLLCLGAIIGFFNLIQEQNVLIISWSFLIVGCALLLSRTKLSYRFHIVQLLIFIVTVFHTTILLSFIYRIFLGAASPHIIYIPLNLTLLFSLLCNAILLRWPNRGFLGIFTTDALSSTLSLRMLFVSVISAPLLGLTGLLWSQWQGYYSYETVVIVVILLMIFLAIFAWLNVKLLYKFELEHYLMKEALRVNNIDLELGQEDLSTKITSLEQTKKQYEEKLDNRTSLTNIVDNTS